jgi:segregation and condensation protein B
MLMEELKRIVEALLFASPDPLTITRIRSIVPGVEAGHVTEVLDALSLDYLEQGRSFQIVEIGGGFQLTTKADYAIWVGKLLESRSQQKLSKAALETLAIVAYKQPVLRSQIEGIRGVNVDGVLRTLMERDLVRMVGRGEGPGRPLLFGTTRDFLMRFGLSRLSDLPKMEEIEELVGEKTAEGDEAPAEGLAGESMRESDIAAEAATGEGAEPGGAPSEDSADGEDVTEDAEGDPVAEESDVRQD